MMGRPVGVTLAAALQLLLAVAFLIIPVVVYRHGPKAQAARGGGERSPRARWPSP
jgi:hypothetical protein